MRKKNNFYLFLSAIQKYLLSDNWVIIISIVTGIGILYSTLAELAMPACLNKLVIAVCNGEDQATAYRLLSDLVKTILTHYIIAYAYFILFSLHLANVKSLILVKMTKEFLEIDYTTYNTLGTGKIATVIERKQAAIANFYKLAIMELGTDLIFFIFALIKIYGNTEREVVTIFTAMLLLSMAHIGFTFCIISSKRRKCNTAENKTRNKNYDLIKNYNIIKAYNSEDKEIGNLERVMESNTRANVKYEIWYRSLDLCFRVFLLSCQVLLLFVAIRSCMAPQAGAGCDIILIGTYFALFKGRIGKLRAHLINLGQIYTDITETGDIGEDKSFSGDKPSSERKSFSESKFFSGDKPFSGDNLETNTGYVLDSQSPASNTKMIANDANNNDIAAESPASREGAVVDRFFTNNMIVNDFKDKIEIRNLSIIRDENVLFDGFSLVIRRGEKIAITGRNGSGKSTLIKTLLGFVEYKGQILIDGVQISMINEKSLRSIVGYIPQDPQLLDSTIWENLTYGSPVEDTEKVVEACKHCCIHQKIMGLKHGYHSKIGEGGKLLSGGQCQMINFLRAVFKDAPIILMDEPTSNLDYTSSRQLLSYMDDFWRDKTILMSTHDLEDLRGFDRIVNIHKHSVVVYNSYKEFYHANQVEMRL